MIEKEREGREREPRIGCEWNLQPLGECASSKKFEGGPTRVLGRGWNRAEGSMRACLCPIID